MQYARMKYWKKRGRKGGDKNGSRNFVVVKMSHNHDIPCASNNSMDMGSPFKDVSSQQNKIDILHKTFYERTLQTADPTSQSNPRAQAKKQNKNSFNQNNSFSNVNNRLSFGNSRDAPSGNF